MQTINNLSVKLMSNAIENRSYWSYFDPYSNFDACERFSLLSCFDQAKVTAIVGLSILLSLPLLCLGGLGPLAVFRWSVELYRNSVVPINDLWVNLRDIIERKNCATSLAAFKNLVKYFKKLDIKHTAVSSQKEYEELKKNIGEITSYCAQVQEKWQRLTSIKSLPKDDSLEASRLQSDWNALDDLYTRALTVSYAVERTLTSLSECIDKNGKKIAKSTEMSIDQLSVLYGRLITLWSIREAYNRSGLQTITKSVMPQFEKMKKEQSSAIFLRQKNLADIAAQQRLETAQRNRQAIADDVQRWTDNFSLSLNKNV